MELTKEIVFKRLDRQLRKKDRIDMACAYDLCAYHFGLGLWIRNTWFNNSDITCLFIEDDSKISVDDISCKVSLVNDRDMFSNNVLKEYQQYLREKYKLTKYDILSPTTDLWNAMVCLDVEKCQQLMRCYDIDIDMTYDGFSGYKGETIEFNPIRTIAKAWDMLIDNTPSYANWKDRNNRIKEMLAVNYGIDFNSVSGDDCPDHIVNKCLQCTFSHLVAEIADTKDVFKERDIDRNLFIAVSMMETDDIKRCMKDGANPDVKFVRDRTALDLCKMNIDDAIPHVGHIVCNDTPEDYPANQMFTDWIWMLLNSASYNMIYNYLVANK